MTKWNIYLFFLSLCCVARSLSISIHRSRRFSPGVPCKNSWNSSKPGLLQTQQVPCQHTSSTITQVFSSRSVLLLRLRPSWQLALSSSPEGFQSAQFLPSSGLLQNVWCPDLVTQWDVLAWLRLCTMFTASLITWLTTLKAKYSRWFSGELCVS